MSNMNLPVLPDGYEYLRELGRGAQGCVWLIRNNNTGGRYEACKVVTSISPKELSRFKREIQLLATLNHPNIITIFYANQKEKFFIMEYVSGGNLYNYCRQQVLNLKQRIRLFSSIAEGLSFAHNKGLIHRDLKPENIVMSEDGVAKITDFGIARLSDSSSQTMNITSGTPSYMAPELWSQSPPDQRSDIWSLGIILYEMLTGKCPFKGTVQEICYMVTQGNLKAPHVVSSLPLLGQKMSVICMKALKQDPQKRYQNCGELLTDIKNAMEKGEDELQTSIGLSADLAFKDDDDDDDAALEDPDFLPLMDDNIEQEVSPKPLTQDNVPVAKPVSMPKIKPVSIAPVKNAGSLDFEDDESELDENSNSLEELPEEDILSKRTIFDQYKYPIIGTAVFFVMILTIFLIMPASLLTLQEQLLSNDLEEQKIAFIELKTRGEEAVESLVYGLNSSQVKMRKDIISHISQYPESASYYLSEAIEDFAKIFNHQAKIYAVRALGNLKADSEISLQSLVIKVSTPEDLRQEAIKSLVKLKPNIYKRKYHFMGGLWLSTRDLRKQGYVKTEQGWVLVSKMFGDLQSKISKASFKYKSLMQTEQKVFDDLAKGKHLYLEDFITDWEKLFSDYKAIVIDFDVLVQSIEGNLDIEKEYSKIIKNALMTLHLSMVECADNFISANATGLAIKILKKELENISLVMSWKRISFPLEKARALKVKHSDLVKENTLFVYTKFSFFGNYDTSSFRDQIVEIMDRTILKEDVYPRFSSKSPSVDKPKHWIVCEYRETNIGSYHGNRDKKRKNIRRLRASCNFSYWVESNKVKSWQQVISSNIYLELLNKKFDDEQKEICNMVRNDFKEQLTSWKPKEFDQQRTKSDSNTVEKIKGSTIYSQTALDIVYTKDKRKIKGLIKKENSKDIVFTVVKISKGSTSFVEIKISKSRIAKIKRIPEEIRETRLRDIKNLSEQRLIDRKKIDLVPLETVPWEFGKGKGLVYSGKFFTLYCNTPENFTREIAFRTESIFEAYQRFFPVTRNSDKKIKIYIFNSTAEYQKAIGRAFVNPAFYSPTKNLIMASCDLVAYESAVAKAKKHNDKIFSAIAKNERIIAKYRNQITRQKRTLHENLDKRLARGQIKQRDYDSTYRKIGDQIDKINRQVNALLKKQKKHRSEVRYIESKNKKLVPKYTNQMIEMMYHEAFHAFMKNFLFTEEQTMYVPRWLNEGLAQYFESSFFSGNRLIIGEMDKDRLRFLKKFTKRKNAVPVKDLLVAGYKDFIVTSSDNLENSNLHYIQSWATVYFVTTLFDLRKGDVFGGYIRNIWSGKDQIKAFEELVGMPINEFEKKWLAFFQE